MKAIFLDKDGTLVDDIPYNVDPQRIALSEGAGDALRIFSSLGYQLFVVSNQSGIARGYFSEADLQPVERKLAELFNDERVELSGFYYCPHHPEGVVKTYAIECDCRKPAPGMLMQAAWEHHIELPASWMIGDILHDVEAGKRAGCRTILIDNGNETEWHTSIQRAPDFVVDNLLEAARIVAEQDASYVGTHRVDQSKSATQ
jgi:D,D-heptose 1,7-bisphosphate phosphatase